MLHGRRELLDAMPPFLGGGHMISNVTVDEIRWAELPGKFEAGTSNIAEAIGLGAAVDFLSELGMDAVRAHERDLAGYALERLVEQCPASRSTGRRTPTRRGALVSFTLDLVHPHDVAEILGSRGRLRASRPPLRAAAHEVAWASGRRPARPSPCTTAASTSTR